MNLPPSYDMSCFAFPTNVPPGAGPRILPTSQRFGPLGSLRAIESGSYRGGFGAVQNVWDTRTMTNYMQTPGLGSAELGPGMMNPNAYAAALVNQATANSGPITQLGLGRCDCSGLGSAGIFSNKYYWGVLGLAAGYFLAKFTKGKL